MRLGPHPQALLARRLASLPSGRSLGPQAAFFLLPFPYPIHPPSMINADPVTNAASSLAR